MKYAFGFVLCSFIGLSTIGCGGTTALEKYPNFASQSAEINHVKLITNTQVLEYVKGGTDILDVSTNKEIGTALQDAILVDARQKGYTIDEVVPPVQCLFENPRTRFIILQDTSMRGAGAESLQPSAIGELSKTVRGDSATMKILVDANKEGPVRNDEGAAGSSQGRSVIVLINAGSVNVSSGTTLGGAITAGLIGFGSYSVSWSSLWLTVIDVNREKIIFKDGIYTKSKDGTKEHFLDVLNEIMSRFPAKSQSVHAK